MPIYKNLCDTPYMRQIKSALHEIAHLPLLARLSHHNARRPLMAIALGVVVMLSGCVVASAKEELCHDFGGHHILWDALGYFLHGAGAIPLLRYIEPLWLLLLGSPEAVVVGAVGAAGEAAAVVGAAIATGGVVAAFDATHPAAMGPPKDAPPSRGRKGGAEPPVPPVEAAEESSAEVDLLR